VTCALHWQRYTTYVHQRLRCRMSEWSAAFANHVTRQHIAVNMQSWPEAGNVAVPACMWPVYTYLCMVYMHSLKKHDTAREVGVDMGGRGMPDIYPAMTSCYCHRFATTIAETEASGHTLAQVWVLYIRIGSGFAPFNSIPTPVPLPAPEDLGTYTPAWGEAYAYNDSYSVNALFAIVLPHSLSIRPPFVLPHYLSPFGLYLQPYV
jgi:hypothetical protein